MRLVACTTLFINKVVCNMSRFIKFVATAGVFFIILEILLSIAPSVMHRFSFSVLTNLPSGLSRWIFTNFRNMDNFTHWMFFVIALIIAIIFSFIPALKNKQKA